MDTTEPLPEEPATIDPVLVAAGSLQEAVQPERRTRRWSRRRSAAALDEPDDRDAWRPVPHLADDPGTGRHAAGGPTSHRQAGSTGASTAQGLEEQLRLTTLSLSAAEASTENALRDRDAAMAARRELTALVAELSAQLEALHLGRREAEAATRAMAEARVAVEEDLAGRLATWSSELAAGLVRAGEDVERAHRLLSDARMEAGRAQALAAAAEQAREEQLATLAAVEHLADDAAAAHEARLQAEHLAAEQVRLHAEARTSAARADAETTRLRDELSRTLEELDQRSRRAGALHAQALDEASAAVRDATATVQHQDELLRAATEREQEARRAAEQERARVSESATALEAALEGRAEDVRRIEELTQSAELAHLSRTEAERRLEQAESEAAEALAAATRAASAETSAHASADEAWRALESHLVEHRQQLVQASAVIQEQAQLLDLLRAEVLVQAEARAQAMLEAGLAPQPTPTVSRLRRRPRPARPAPTVDPAPRPALPVDDGVSRNPGSALEAWLTPRAATFVRDEPSRAAEPTGSTSSPVPAEAPDLDAPVRPLAPAARTHPTSAPVAAQPEPTTVPAAPAAGLVSPQGEPTAPVRRRRGGTTIELVGGVLYIWRRKNHHIFDLTARASQIEVVGVPGQRGWRVLFHRRGLTPVVLTAAEVDAAWLTQVLAEHGVS